MRLRKSSKKKEQKIEKKKLGPFFGGSFFPFFIFFFWIFFLNFFFLLVPLIWTYHPATCNWIMTSPKSCDVMINTAMSNVFLAIPKQFISDIKEVCSCAYSQLRFEQDLPSTNILHATFVSGKKTLWFCFSLQDSYSSIFEF